MSFRTSPQTGVGIPLLDAGTTNLGPNCLKIRGIATTVCALSCNDMVFDIPGGYTAAVYPLTVYLRRYL